MIKERSLKKTNHRFSCLSLSLGVIYLWFGMLKFFPGVSPAEELASETIAILTFHLLEGRLSLILLAVWECTLGCLLLLNVLGRVTIPLALLHILLTFSPMVLLPEKVFAASPLVLTLTGQYIVKNFVIISVLFALWQQHKTGSRVKSPVSTN